MGNIAIITARGGSKRIPKKNIRQFCGKPMLAYAIEAAIESTVFDEVMVSTDSDEIAEIARQYGASVPTMRSQENANDFATTADVLVEVLEYYQEQGRTFDFACCLYPTAPFVTPDILRQGMRMLQTYEVSTVMPVVPFSFPPQRGLVCREGILQAVSPEYMNCRSQDLETIYHDCGQFYCFDVRLFLKTKKLIDGQVMPIVLSELEVQDIDNESDWKIAEMKYQLMLEANKREI